MQGQEMHGSYEAIMTYRLASELKYRVGDLVELVGEEFLRGLSEVPKIGALVA